MTTHVIGDTAVLTSRSLRHILRSPDTIITTAVTPIALMLLFTYVFGGAIDTGSQESYIDYMLPGILLITIASGVAYTAYRLFLDMQGGIFERFQSMPIARSSVLWAHVFTSLAANLVSIAIVVAVGILMGFRTGASVLDWLAVTGILVLFTLALTWIAVIAGLSAKTVDGASAFSYPLIFLPFISSAFVPTESMPAPVAWFAENQPVTADRRHPPRLVRRSSRSAPTSGSPSPGSWAFSWWHMPSPSGSIAARSAEQPDHPPGAQTPPVPHHRGGRRLLFDRAPSYLKASLTFSPACLMLALVWSALPSASRRSLSVALPVASLALPLRSSAALLILSSIPMVVPFSLPQQVVPAACCVKHTPVRPARQGLDDERAIAG